MRILMTHGRAQEYQIGRTMRADWANALREGLDAAGYRDVDQVEIDFAFYGSIWRPDRLGTQERAQSVADERLALHDAQRTRSTALQAGLVADMTGDGALGGERLDWPRLVDLVAALDRTFHVSEFILTRFLEDVDEYLRDEAVRQQVHERLREALGDPQPTILMGHSMGSIVAYDFLMQNRASDLGVAHLVTFGSPLGLTAIRERLAVLNGSTDYPITLETWVNVSNAEDFATAVPALAPLYGTGGAIRDVEAQGRRPSVWDAGGGHDPLIYLSSTVLGREVQRLLGPTDERHAELGETVWVGTDADHGPERAERAWIESDRGVTGGTADAVSDVRQSGQQTAGEGGAWADRGSYVRYEGTAGTGYEGSASGGGASSGVGAIPGYAESYVDEDRGSSPTLALPPQEAMGTPPTTEVPREAPGDAGTDVAGGTRTVNKVLSADFPPVVLPQSTHDLLFAIGEQALYARSTGMAIVAPVDQDVVRLRVGIQAADFELLPLSPDGGGAGNVPAFVDVDVKLDDRTHVARGAFRLRAADTRKAQTTVIYLTVYRGNLPIGVLPLEASIDPEFKPARSPVFLNLAEGRAQDPDFVFIVEDRSNGQLGEGPFALYASKEGKYINKPLGTWRVPGTAWKFARLRLARFHGITRAEADPEERIRAAKDLGIAIWNELPPEFKAFYWDEWHGRDVSISIYSQEPYIPWELVVPQREQGGEVADFLGAMFPIARWRQSVPFPDPLVVSDMTVIAPIYDGFAYSELPQAQKEAADLEHTFGARRIDSDRRHVRELLESTSGVQIIHFSGHGAYDPDTSDQSLIHLSDGDLTPANLASATLGRSAHPFVFLNACEVGDRGWELTKIGGWADAFCDIGFAGFLGPYWPVNDTVASAAAVLFYEQLRDGRTVGEAARQVRRQFQEGTVARGHPSWLAYTLQCQPNIHVRMPRVETPVAAEQAAGKG